MDNVLEYRPMQTDWSKFVELTPQQRQQLIREKIERYKMQSDKNYNITVHARYVDVT